MRNGALSGIRVLDLGIITAGAATSAILADLGADVVKIESAAYADPFRVWAGEAEASPFFRATNRNKRGLALDLKTPAGRDQFLLLVEKSDVIVENFRRGVLNALGLGYDVLARHNSEIILASISSQGDDGPMANYVSFGTTLEAMSGMAAFAGYADGAPAVSGHDLNYPDQVVALFASGMVISALHRRDRGGGGAHLDLSQRELATFLCGDLFASAQDRQTRYREANDGIHPLQGAFAVADGGWLAVSVPPEAMGRVENWIAECGDTGLPGVLARLEMSAAVARLHALGAMAQPVLPADAAARSAIDRGSKAIARDPEGFAVKGFPFSLADHPLTIDRAAPAIGQHSDDILDEYLGRASRAHVVQDPSHSGGD